MKHEGREVWEQRVERWRDSGLTAKEFAAEVGCNVHTLTHWKWRLSAGARSATSAARSAEVPRFVEVVASASEPTTAVTREAPAAFEVILASGIRVRVPPRFESTALRALMSALEGH